MMKLQNRQQKPGADGLRDGGEVQQKGCGEGLREGWLLCGDVQLRGRCLAQG